MRPILRAGVLLLLLSLAIYSCQNAPQPTEVPTADLGGPSFNTALVAFEELTDIDIPLGAGTGIVAAGVGMRGDPAVVQPGTITIDVPGDVVQVILYW